jgi:hypothetical protein
MRLRAVTQSFKRLTAKQYRPRALHGKLPASAYQTGNSESRFTGQAFCKAAQGLYQ